MPAQLDLVKDYLKHYAFVRTLKTLDLIEGTPVVDQGI